MVSYCCSFFPEKTLSSSLFFRRKKEKSDTILYAGARVSFFLPFLLSSMGAIRKEGGDLIKAAGAGVVGITGNAKMKLVRARMLL